MAEKRMFSSNVIDSDAFLDMSPTARLLYYDLGMRADDDGFIDSPKKIMRIIGAQESDLNELVDKKFLIKFDSGVIAIRHWCVNNRVRRDTYHKTIYTEEMSMLILEKNNVYQVRDESVTESLQDSNETVSQIRVDKDRVDKVRLDKDRLEIECACEESIEEPAESTQLSNDDNRIICMFPTKKGDEPVYQKDIDELTRLFNGAVDVRLEILSCMAYYEENHNPPSSWKNAVKVWINRGINYNNSAKFVIEEKMKTSHGRGHRSMEPDKYIEAEDAGL